MKTSRILVTALAMLALPLLLTVGGPADAEEKIVIKVATDVPPTHLKGLTIALQEARGREVQGARGSSAFPQRPALL